MRRKAWSNAELVPYHFSRSSVSYSNFNVTWDKKLPISTRIERLQLEFTDQWEWNDAQNLIWYKRGALLFFGVIHQISRSHGLKNWQYESYLSNIIRPVAAIKSLRFALFMLLYFLFLAATKQLYEWYFPSVRLSVCHTFLSMFPSSYHHEIFRM